MDDLISRSAVINVLKECYLDEQLFEKDVFDKIKAMPTAYDVDTVVEELENQAEQYRQRGFEAEAKGYSGMADKNYGKYCSYKYATEIVRKGGGKYGE